MKNWVNCWAILCKWKASNNWTNYYQVNRSVFIMLCLLVSKHFISSNVVKYLFLSRITFRHHSYIYIFINVLSTSIHGYQEKRKKKKKTLPGTRDKNISNHRPGEKRKNIIGKKKEEKANYVTPVEKNQVSWSKEK